MRVGKSLLLGSAAGLMAVSAGQAADLPVKAKPVEYVKVCSLYGAGFFYIPGTDKCIKLGGYFREQWDIHGAGDGQAYMTTSGATWTRTGTSDSSFRTRQLVSIDVREQSAYGTIRGYTAFGATATTPNDQNSAVFFNRSFVQFAGFTGGRAVSFYDFLSFDPYGYDNIRTNNGNTGATGINVFAYTSQLGNGASFTVSAEDACAENNLGTISGSPNGRQCLVNNSSIAGGLAPGVATWDNAGYNIPDVVAALRVDQAWGSAQVMSAYHKVGAGYYGTSTAFSQNLGHPDDRPGWVVGAGFLLTNFLGMQGDTFGMQGAFAEGAMGYLTNGTGALIGYSGGANGFGNSIGFAGVADGIFSSSAGCPAGAAAAGTAACGTSIELTTGWSVTGLYEHRWTPQWKTSVYGGYVKISDNDTAASYYCTGGSPAFVRGGPSTVAGSLGVLVSSCDPNTSFWSAGTRTQWNPNSNLDLGVDFMWNHLNTANGGIASLPAVGARPATVGGTLAAPNSTWYNISNYDVYTVALRAQYNFLP
jgi:Porin subfamily